MDYDLINTWIEVKDPKTEFKNTPINKIELKRRSLFYEREKKYEIDYKGTILSHYYFSDFVGERNIILEVKAQEGVVENHTKQTINYLVVSKCEIGLLVNFGEESLKYKRIILTK